MTQAIALAAFLRDAGHEVARVLVGTSHHRSVPAYFREGIGAPVTPFAAPTQVPGRARRGVSAARTFADSLLRMPGFLEGGSAIHRASAQADVVVCLLDLVGGLSRVLFRTRTPAVAIAHNHLFEHPELAGAPGAAIPRGFVRLYARLTASRCDTSVALSFVPMSVPAASKLVVAPPLLRPGLDRLEPHDGGYLLAYALNAGYADDLAAWQRARGDVTVHCYVDGGAAGLGAQPSRGFHAHDLDEASFLAHLAGCRAYVGSAGFESLCEALHLGKPALAVPTEGQLEQRLNAWDAERCGAARAGTYADLDDFWEEPATPDAGAVARFRAWVARAPAIVVEVIERAAARGRAGSAGGGGR